MQLVVCDLVRPVRLKGSGVLVVQDSVDLREAKVFGAHAPQGLCDQKDGDSPVENIVTGLQDKSRKGVMDGLRNFIEVDNHAAVNVGGLHRGIKSARVVRPNLLKVDYPEAVIREGADELSLRAAEVGVLRTFIDTADVEDLRWEPPLVDADWHAFCQAIYQGIEGKEWETMYYHCKELHLAVGTKKLGDNRRAKALWAMKAAKDREDTFYDPTHQKDIQERAQTRQRLWEEHLKQIQWLLWQRRRSVSKPPLNVEVGSQVILSESPLPSVGWTSKMMLTTGGTIRPETNSNDFGGFGIN